MLIRSTTNLPPDPPVRTLSDALAYRRRRLRLTERWLPMKPHQLQQAFMWHPARFKVNPSGRRSGKTECVKRKAVLKLLMRRPWPVRMFLAAPTLDQARQIYWDDIKALVPDAWKAKVSETRLEIVTHWGAMLRVVGFDKPKRIEGIPWDWCAIDEMADCPPRCFALNVRPALSTLGREGGADLVGVPDEVGRNQAEYEEMYEYGLRWRPGLDQLTEDQLRAEGADPEVCSFHWASADILGAKEIAALRRGLDAFAFEQEMGGRFVTSGGKACPQFDKRVHVDVENYWCEYSSRLPLDWALDFGAANGASLLLQGYRGHVWVMDEVHFDNEGATDVQWQAVEQLIGQRGYGTHHGLRIFGDAAGQFRSSPTGQSDYDLLAERTSKLPVEWHNLDRNPLVKDTLNSVRGRLATADGVVHLHVHKRCKRLIADLQQAPWPDPHQLRQFHTLAALRYYCYALFGEGSGFNGSTGISLPNLGGTGAEPAYL